MPANPRWRAFLHDLDPIPDKPVSGEVGCHQRIADGFGETATNSGATRGQV